MRFEERVVELKDGAKVRLVPATPEYAARLLGHFKKMPLESKYMMRESDEIGLPIAIVEDIWCVKALEDKQAVEMLAVYGNRIVGHCSIIPMGPWRRVRGCATLAISIRASFRGRGLGRAMESYAIELARESGCRRLEACPMARNKESVELLKKMGFHYCGKRHSVYYTGDPGFYEDEYIYERFFYGR